MGSKDDVYITGYGAAEADVISRNIIISKKKNVGMWPDTTEFDNLLPFLGVIPCFNSNLFSPNFTKRNLRDE